MPLPINHFGVVKINRKLKDLAKLLKYAEEEPFLDDAEHDLLAFVYAFVVVQLVRQKVVKSQASQEHNPIRSGVISNISSVPGARNMTHVA
jgi:hypothetical protein